MTQPNKRTSNQEESKQKKGHPIQSPIPRHNVARRMLCFAAALHDNSALPTLRPNHDNKITLCSATTLANSPLTNSKPLQNHTKSLPEWVGALCK